MGPVEGRENFVVRDEATAEEGGLLGPGVEAGDEAQLATAIRGAPLNPNDPTAIWISDAIIVDEVETDSVPATAATSRQF